MFDDLKEYALINHIPIIKDEGLSFLLLNIKKYNIKDVLEVGSAIGYSALNMASLGINVTTIERNLDMYNEAIKNISKYNFQDKIEVVYMDALSYTPNKLYDLIFIDAAKAQNQKFFLRFTPFLKVGGIVIVDNLNFHGLIDEIDDIKSKNLRSMLKKIKAFREWLIDNSDYKSEIIDVGDGMSISVKLR